MKKTITKFFLIFKIIFVTLLIISCEEKITKPNQPPTVTITGGPSGTINTNQATFSWSGSDIDGTISGYYYDLDDSTPDTWTSSTTKTFSSLSNGSHTFYVKAKDDDGDYSEIISRFFTVSIVPDSPTLYSPSNGTTINENTPTFDWNDPTYAYRYELIVDNNSSFTSPEINETDLSSSNYTPSSTLSNDTYYWKVRVQNSSGTWGNWSSPTWSFTVYVENVPEPPTLYSPSNGSTINDNTPTFDWNDPTYAYRYELIVDNNSSFSLPEIHETNLNTSNYTPSSFLSNDTYYWKVRAQNSSGTWGNWSSPTWSFTVYVENVPEPPTLYSPSNGSTINDNTPTFDWNDPTYATGYHLQVDDDDSFTTPVLEVTNLSQSTYTATYELENGIYFWRVRAKNSASVWGNWSLTWSFTVDVDIEFPNPNEIVEIDITDDNIATNTFCNHDGQVNVTEDISLEVKVKNNGNATAYNITGEISLPGSDLNCCNIDDPFSSFPNISPGSSEWSINDFDFWVYCMPSDEDLDFTLTLNYEDENCTQYELQIFFVIDIGEEPIPIIDSATLQLTLHYSSGVGSYSDLQLYKCDSYFNESGNCGTFSGSSWNMLGYGNGSTVYWDAIDIVEYWIIDGGVNYGFQVYPQYNGNDYLFKFYTSESSSTNYPKLTINYHWEGQGGQFIEDTANMDITFWYCNGSDNGCDIIPPDYYLMNAGRSSGSMCSGGEIYFEIPKVYFDINESDF